MKRKTMTTTAGLLAAVFLLTACFPASDEAVPVVQEEDVQETYTAAPAEESAETEPVGSEPASETEAQDPFEGVRIRFNPDAWPDTDFSRRSIDYSEILSGGPPPDGIPSIDAPVFETPGEADEWLEEEWPVLLLQIDESVRIYPMGILVYHEIVNDVVSGEPVSITYCPLCNSAVVYDRTLESGEVLDFGTTGNLRNSDLVMYDRQTKSWWQQFTGEAIVGELTGQVLEPVPSQILPWDEAFSLYPDAKVLSRETGHNRPYGSTPYFRYDTAGDPFLFEGELDRRLDPTERVVTVEIEGETRAYPFEALREQRVVNDEVGGVPVVIFWQEGTESLFSPEFETGSTAVYVRELDDSELTFQAAAGGFTDQETGTAWNILGEALSGELQGTRLQQVNSMEAFWFAWSAFKPDTGVWTVE